MTPCISSSNTHKLEIFSDDFELDLEFAVQNNSLNVGILSASNKKSSN